MNKWAVGGAAAGLGFLALLFGWGAMGAQGNIVTVKVLNCAGYRDARGVPFSLYVRLYQGDSEKYFAGVCASDGETCEPCVATFPKVKPGQYVMGITNSLGVVLLSEAAVTINGNQIYEFDGSQLKLVTGSGAGGDNSMTTYAMFDITNLRVGSTVSSTSIAIKTVNEELVRTLTPTYNATLKCYSAQIDIAAAAPGTVRKYKVYATVAYTDGSSDVVGWHLQVPRDVGKTLHFQTPYRNGRIELPMTAGDLGNSAPAGR